MRTRSHLWLSKERKLVRHLFTQISKVKEMSFQVSRQQGEAMVSSRFSLALLGSSILSLRPNTSEVGRNWRRYWAKYDVPTKPLRELVLGSTVRQTSYV